MGPDSIQYGWARARLFLTLVAEPHSADGAVSAVEEPRLEDLLVEPLVLVLVQDGDELDAELVAARLRLGPVEELGRVQLQVVALVAVAAVGIPANHVELAEV